MLFFPRFLCAPPGREKLVRRRCFTLPPRKHSGRADLESHPYTRPRSASATRVNPQRQTTPGHGILSKRILAPTRTGFGNPLRDISRQPLFLLLSRGPVSATRLLGLTVKLSPAVLPPRQQLPLSPVGPSLPTRVS